VLVILKEADELGMRPLAARCHRGLGTLYRDTSDQPKSERHLTTALGLFREMAMESWVVQVEQLLKLSRLPERSWASTPSGDFFPCAMILLASWLRGSILLTYFILQLAESHLTRRLFGQILGRIEQLAWHPT
jgi:hypothetical protein